MFIGPGEAYQLSGYIEYQAWLAGLNTLAGTRVGRVILQFKDGGLLSFKDPVCEMSGIVAGDKILNFSGKSIIKDHMNKMEVEIIYNPSEEN